MKKLVIVLFVLGLTSLGFSQIKNGQINEVILKAVVITNANFSYLEKVQGDEMSNYVSLLQNEAASFNIFETSEYDGHNESFTTVFRGNKGIVIATYDNKGKILKTSERYKNIKLPINIRKAMLNQYPKCSLLKVVYSLNYNAEKEVEKTYNIKIKINNETKNLKFNLVGNLNKAVTMRRAN